jgi:phosphoglycolate phosphatase
MPNCYLFDLDGTLVDTAPEIADAVNASLRRLGLGRVTDEQVRSWIGDGARTLVGRALAAVGVAPADLAVTTARAWSDFELDYADHCGRRSAVYPGVRAALARLTNGGARLACVTNKESAFAHRVLQSHDLHGAFEMIVAGDTLAVRKPDPAVIHFALAALDADADDTVLIGDSVTDVRTARAAGIAVWAVRHGYHQGGLTGADTPDRFLDHFDELAPAQNPAERLLIA